MSSDTSADNNVDTRSNQFLTKRVLSSFEKFIKRLITRKTIEDIEYQIQTHHKLRESINGFLLTGIGLGAIIGK
jgi:hypothetical protein